VVAENRYPLFRTMLFCRPLIFPAFAANAKAFAAAAPVDSPPFAS